jgi:predicted small lipoprotein YifL
MKWVLEELLQKMSNGVKISTVLMISALLAACGQSGPLYMPGQATGVHKKDVFLLNSDGTEVQTSTVKDNAQDKTQDKTKPAANAPQTTSTPTAAETTTQPVPATTGTEQPNKPSV